MDIKNIGAGSLPISNITAGKTEKAAVNEAIQSIETKDAFVSTAGSEPAEKSMKSLTGIAGKVLNSQGLQKQDYNYRVRSQTQSADGTTYIAYADYSKAEGNYISSIAPDGTVNWEVCAGQDGLQSIENGPDGTLYAKTGKTLMGYNPDGSIRFRHEFETEVKDHFMDKKGNNFFRESNGNKLYAVDVEGNRIQLPLKVRSLTPSEIKPLDDGTFLIRNYDTVQQVDLQKGNILKSVEFKEPDPNLNRNVMDCENLKDGILLTTQYTKTISHHAYDADLHMGLGGFGFGRRFHPHLPPIDDVGSFTSIQRRYLVKMDSAGEIAWSTGDLGSDLEVSVLSDDRAIFKGDYNYTEKRATIKQVKPDGNIEYFATIEGDSISKIHHRKSDDNLFVEHGSKISILSPDGKKTGELEKVDDKSGLSIREFDNDGNLIMQNSSYDSLYRWDVKTDTLTPLTDHQKDYSYKTVKFDDVMEEDGGEKKTIQKEKDFIVIGGVRVPVSKGSHG